MNTKSLLITLASGLLAGAVVALLTAPATGSDTRRKLAGTAQKLKTRFQRLVGRASGELDELQNIIQNQSEKLEGDVKQRILQLIAAAKVSHTNLVAAKEEA